MYSLDVHIKLDVYRTSFNRNLLSCIDAYQLITKTLIEILMKVSLTNEREQTHPLVNPLADQTIAVE